MYYFCVVAMTFLMDDSVKINISSPLYNAWMVIGRWQQNEELLRQMETI